MYNLSSLLKHERISASVHRVPARRASALLQSVAGSAVEEEVGRQAAGVRSSSGFSCSLEELD